MAACAFATVHVLLLVAALPLCSLSADAAAAPVQQALSYAREHQHAFNEQLMDLIAIPSISALPGANRAHCVMCPEPSQFRSLPQASA
jgi:hypothetical protein